MSLLANHGLIQGTRLAPSFITYNAGINSTNTYPVVTGLTPTPGSIIIISAGGSTNRNVVTHPIGFTHLPSVSGGIWTNNIWYKIMDGTEGTSFPIVWSGVLNGGWDLMEFRDVDVVNPLAFQAGSAVTAGTSVVLPSYNAIPGVAFSAISKSGTSSWTPNAGFTDLAGAGEHKHAYKIYSSVVNSEVLTWSGTSETVMADLIFIRGKII